MIRRLSSRVLLACALILGFGAFSGRAADAPQASTYLSALTGPVDQVQAFLAQLGIPLPKEIEPAALEQMFGFIGAGGFRLSGSAGMLMGPPVPGTDKPNAIIVLPVNPQAATIKSFLDLGGVGIEGSNDTVKLNGTPFRRTEGYLMFGGSDTDILAIDPAAAAKRIADAKALAEIDIDFARFRTLDPAGFAKMLDGMDDKDPNINHSRQLGRDTAKEFFKSKLDHLRMALSHADQSILLRTSMEPFVVGEARPVPKPAFPKASFGRMDIVYPTTESSLWVLTFADMIEKTVEQDGGFKGAIDSGATPEKIKGIMNSVIQIAWVADAISIAIEPAAGGKVVYHQVNQYRKPSDFTARVTAWVKDMNAMSKAPGDKIDLSTYKAGDATVTRLLSAKEHSAVDFIDTGTTVRIVAAADEEKRIPALLQLPAAGTIVSVCAGSLDAGLMATTFRDNPDSPLATMPKAQADALVQAFQGQNITWNTTGQGKSVIVDLNVPEQLVKSLMAIFAPQPN
jgi:hypothetical protein